LSASALSHRDLFSAAFIINIAESDFSAQTGIASVHPIQGDELRALRELRRQTEGAFVFGSERGGPMTRFNVSKMVEAAGDRAGLPYAHPHMLRHTCGHLLADAGHDTRRLQLWLGHVDIKHTAHYSQLSASPFKEFWK
jgi:integrase